ncbi:MAG: TonB-dependent receptor [Ignavibacteriales bacterium]|nr:TonB-dependent receptor [Ignavibacteriales bacterium]
MAINFSHIIRKNAHLILICIALIGFFTTSSIFAQKTAQVTGRITDADTKEYLPGANVVLKGTRFGDATDKVGNYKISNVPPGAYELVVTYIGYVDQTINITVGTNGATVKQNVAISQTEVKMGEVVVTGLRQGQTKAMNVQKTSDKIVNIVSQEQMVRLPDLNTAEILQRISGISIVRDQGEGRYVQIRGTDARLTSVSVNGEKIIAPDPGERYVGMDVISASQAASIEVSKTVTPDMDGDAVGGSVNIKSKSAFDSDKPFFNITAGTGTSDIMGKPLWQGGFTYGSKFGDENQFGFAITGNYDKWERETWDLESTYNDLTIGGVDRPQSLTDVDFRNYNVSRERINVAANLEYQPSTDNTFFIRGMYNNRDDYEYRRNLYIRPSKGTFTDLTTITKGKVYQGLKDRLERQNIFALSAGGINKIDDLILDYTVAYNEGGTKKNDETDPQFVMTSSLNMALNLSDPQRPNYRITSTGATADQFNSDNFKMDQVKYNNDNATDRDYMAGANLKYDFKLADYPSTLKLGGKIHLREKVKTQDRYVYKWGGASNLLLTQFVGDDVNIYDGTYRLGRIIDGTKFRPFFESMKNKAGGFVGEIDHINSEGSSFTADENTIAYYVMDTWKLDDWMVIAGVRHEFTDLTNKSSEIQLDANGDYLSTTPREATLSYNNFLPSLQVRYRVSSMSNIRFSYTNTLARPNFFDLVPYKQVDPDGLTVLEGNASLIPTTSTALDLLAEYYFEEGGLISGGVFYKKLNDIIFMQTSKISGGLYDGYWHTQPVNGGTSTLVGAEVNFEYQLKFLPGFLDGFGLAANYAYTHSSADVGGRLERAELPGQAANVANFVVSYEKFGFTGRFSIGYNGQFVEEVGTSSQYDRIYKAHTQMDISASQDIISGLQIYFEWINVNDAPMIYYQGDENHPLQQEWYASWMHFGFKYKM